MNTKDVHTKLALAFFYWILLIAVSEVQGQYSSYQSESSYSLPRYENENQNYYDNSDLDSADEYSSDPYQRQQFQYNGNGVSDIGDFDVQDTYNQPHQPLSNYQEYLNENVFQFQQPQDSYGRPYSNRQSAGYEGRRPSSSVAGSLHKIIGFNKTESMNNYRMADDNVKYPPLDSEIHLGQPMNKQHQLRAAPGQYSAADNQMSSPSAPNHLNYHHPQSYEGKVNPAPKDNTFSSNTETLMRMLGMSSISTPISTISSQLNVKPNIQREELDEDQQQHISDASQALTHFASPLHSNTSLSHTFYVADSDHMDVNSHQPLLEAHSIPIHIQQKYLVQLPHVVSSPPPVPAPYPLGNPIPISKHVEITKHIPVPVYRKVHVPFRKPVRIEIPRAVISTHTRPYPIKIPTVTKTVAFPMVREVKIPIEKVMPYPVEHRVPYIVQKRVPFEVEKQITVPKYYPYPVKVPMVRTILHKNKAHLHHSSLLGIHPQLRL